VHRKISHKRPTLCPLRDRRAQETVDTGRANLPNYGGVNPREMDDLSSELGLRKVALPCEDIKDETAAVVRRIGPDNDPEGHARISDRIHKFRDDLERPRN
jgi:hypothetical protein